MDNTDSSKNENEMENNRETCLPPASITPHCQRARPPRGQRTRNAPLQVYATGWEGKKGDCYSQSLACISPV